MNAESNNNATDLIRDMAHVAGHVIKDCNPYDLPGVEMYAAGPGDWTVKWGYMVRVHPDMIVIYYKPNRTSPMEHTTPTEWVVSTVCDSVAEFLAWCKLHGELKKPSPVQDWCD